jgi:predicted MPP superfamily phosphohydrolase
MLSRRQFLKSFGALGLAALPYGLLEPLWRLRVARYSLFPRGWPDGLRLKIAALADLHACEPWMGAERIADIVAQTNALNPDLIVLLGDYVAGHRWVLGPMESCAWAEPLAALRAPLGVHAILGNHDWWHDRAVQRAGKGPPFPRQALEDAGIRVYENDVARIGKSGQAFWLAGLGDQLAFAPSHRQRPNGRVGVDDLGGTLAKVTDGAPLILLAHEPDIVRRVPERVSLMLSGHTHGGQVRLLGWSPVSPSGRRLTYGHVRDRCDLIVSGGLGCSIIPVRIGVPPEIVLVSLGQEELAGEPGVPA